MVTRGPLCTYCGAPLDKTNRSRDHAVPKCLFSEKQRSGLLLVAACKACNNDAKSADDVYFRDWLLCDMEVDHCAVPQDVYEAFKRSAGDNPEGKVRSQLVRDVDARGLWVVLDTPDGCVETKTIPLDSERLERTGTHIVQALHYALYQERPPDHATYHVGRVELKNIDATLQEFRKLNPKTLTLGGGECTAFVAHVKEAAGVAVLALLVFYNSIAVYVGTKAPATIIVNSRSTQTVRETGVD